jgi:hypothetical protein
MVNPLSAWKGRTRLQQIREDLAAALLFPVNLLFWGLFLYIVHGALPLAIWSGKA